MTQPRKCPTARADRWSFAVALLWTVAETIEPLGEGERADELRAVAVDLASLKAGMTAPEESAIRQNERTLVLDEMFRCIDRLDYPRSPDNTRPVESGPYANQPGTLNVYGDPAVPKGMAQLRDGHGNTVCLLVFNASTRVYLNEPSQ